MLRIDETISVWKKRCLTPIGKITVIKSLILSQLNHLFMSIPVPSTDFCDKLNRKLFNFLWDGKPDKIKRSIITQNKCNGGLKMPNVQDFIISLKSTWIKRLVLSPDSPWAKLFQISYGSIENLYNFGSYWGTVVNDKIPNKFWKEVFDAWNLINDKLEAKNKVDILTTPLWYNRKLGLNRFYNKMWHKNGIHYLGDIVNNNLVVQDREILEQTYDFKISNFLDYIQIRSSVRRYIAEVKDIINIKHSLERPFIPYHMRIILECKQGCKNIYNRIISKKTEARFKTKWNLELNKNIDDDTWKRAFRIMFNYTLENSLIWLQYRIIHRILGVGVLLNKMAITQTNLCRICNSEPETLLHLFVNCKQVKNLWTSLEKWIYTNVRIKLSFC